MEIRELIESFQADGSLDSSGSFTISLAQARRKMLDFQGLQASRYLLHLVAACIGSGSEGLQIEQDRHELVLESSGSYLPEAEVVGGFQGIFSGQCTERSLDLILGLQSAFVSGAQEISIWASAPGQSSYLWRLTPDSEEQEKLAEQKARSIRIEIIFGRRSLGDKVRSLFRRRKGGYFELSEESRVVDSRCEHALTPIEINGQSVNRAYHIPPGPVMALVGKPAAVSFTKLCIERPAKEWQGALTLAPGPLKFVVAGVSHKFERPSFLSGIVYCDQLSLDLSRLQIVEDVVYRRVLAELQDLRVEMVSEVLKEWQKVEAEHHNQVLNELSDLLANGFLQLEQGREVLSKLEQEGFITTSVLELLRIWVSECEFSGLTDFAQEVASSAYRLMMRYWQRAHPGYFSLEQMFLFARHAFPNQSKILAWSIMTFLSACQSHRTETEYWYKTCLAYLEYSHPSTKKHLIPALDYMLIHWFRVSGQERVANHRMNLWKSRNGSLLRFSAEDFTARLRGFAFEEQEVARAFGETR